MGSGLEQQVNRESGWQSETSAYGFIGRVASVEKGAFQWTTADAPVSWHKVIFHGCRGDPTGSVTSSRLSAHPCGDSLYWGDQSTSDLASLPRLKSPECNEKPQKNKTELPGLDILTGPAPCSGLPTSFLFPGGDPCRKRKTGAADRGAPA